MKIAWRYQNLPKMEASPAASSRFGHYYDVSKTLSPELLQSTKWHRFFLPEEISLQPNINICNMTSGYTRLLQSIQRIIYQEGFDGSHPQKKQKNILRIGIQNLGSVLWGEDICCTDNPEDVHSLTKFLYILRSLLRMSLSACIITVPAHLIQIPQLNCLICDVSDTKDLAFRLKRKLFTIEAVIQLRSTIAGIIFKF
ncbi:elongator complex protein 4 isoform X5 [Alligator sinensis]|uniref:Elongator complex protein 4 n=1 Tax=Alligator sinensis TaxID=38654 RepID=A0A3Q0HF32_ALLSI|nr:elongator complex protein 4 isoform X5 [Alligator sinensis]